MLICILYFTEHFLDVLCNHFGGKKFIVLNLFCNFHVQRRNIDPTTLSSTLSILIFSQVLPKSFSLACFLLPHSMWSNYFFLQVVPYLQFPVLCAVLLPLIYLLHFLCFCHQLAPCWHKYQIKP